MISAKKLAKRILFPRQMSGSDGLESCSGVEKGHFAVYTAEGSRFVVPLAYLNNPVFRQLLEMSEEEYGLPCNGPIVLPCDSVFMDYAICLIRKGRPLDLHPRSRCSSACSLHQGKKKKKKTIHHLPIHSLIA